MSDTPSVALAKITVMDGPPDLKGKPPLEVHFNPASLQLTLSNELKDGARNGPKQYIAKATAKLKMELIFDTTGTGQSVLLDTTRLQALVIPPTLTAPSKQHPAQTPPPTVKFEWGALAFQGIAEGYQETIDFFSAEGVPLRATVSITLSQQDKIFDLKQGKADVGSAGGSDFTVTTKAMSPAELANRAQAPGAARGIAAANGAESLRVSFGAELAIGATVQLSGPVAFASLGGSFGAGVGGGLGLELGGDISAGAGLGVSAGLSAGVGFSADASISGGISLQGGVNASGLTGLSATEGAFAGLRADVEISATPPRLDVRSFSASTGAGASVSTDSGASFRVGGRANFDGPSGLRTDVGAGGSLSGRLSFDA